MQPMHYYDNNNMYLADLLSVPLVHRCAELGLLIDRCSLKDLQHFFPLLVQHIFGNVPGGSQIGWGLRTTTGLTNAHEFDVMYSFFIPMGPMFRLCYRLLNESIKFEVPIDMLPAKTARMLYGGRYAQFYADMINVDPTVRQITSLSMNAFDYYMLHFALHGMHPLHLMHPAAMDVHNEKRKTLYIFLVADYMCSFLPSHPDAVVMPSNICGTMKMSSIMTPIQPSIQPARSPKYIKLSALGSPPGSPQGTQHTAPVYHTPISTYDSSALHLHRHCGPGTPMSGSGNAAVAAATSLDNCGGQQRTAWRTESVLHLFVDTWLRCDLDAHLELPSSEFIRAVRICVKQMHAFANAADLDSSPMTTLRSAVHPLIQSATYALLCALIRRWPMDSSFSVVLELWLSYIQPWRYSFERIHGATGMLQPPADWASATIQRRFEAFVKDNMQVYTQVLVQLLPRFERLNFASLKNVLMMSRLLKVFAQANLAELLRANEFDVYATVSFMSSSSPQQKRGIGQRSPSAWPGIGYRSASGNTSGASESAMMSTSTHSGGGGGVQAANNDDDTAAQHGYVCMFGPEVQQLMLQIGERMLCARQTELDRAAYLQAEDVRRQGGSNVWRRWLRWLVVCEEDVTHAQMLADCRKIPDLLDGMLGQLVQIFEVELPEVRAGAAVDADVRSLGAEMLLDETDRNNSFDMSMSFTEGETIRPPNSITYTVDPAVVPTKSNELTFLVRFLYQLSSKLNVMYHHEMEAFWYRGDLLGSMARQVLSAPLVVHSFDKSHGISRVCEQRLRPRINLRPLASYQAVIVIAMSFVCGQIVYGVPSFGFIALLLLAAVYVLVLGLFGGQQQHQQQQQRAAEY